MLWTPAPRTSISSRSNASAASAYASTAYCARRAGHRRSSALGWRHGLKVMAQMDIAERRVPQDGRIKLTSDGAAIDFRASTLPTVYGEKVVLRVLDASSARLNIDQLGFEPEQRQRYVDALRRPQGMVLVTGPTGSGKTVTLYAGLNVLNAEHRNIATARTRWRSM